VPGESAASSASSHHDSVREVAVAVRVRCLVERVGLRQALSGTRPRDVPPAASVAVASRSRGRRRRRRRRRKWKRVNPVLHRFRLVAVLTAAAAARAWKGGRSLRCAEEAVGVGCEVEPVVGVAVHGARHQKGNVVREFVIPFVYCVDTLIVKFWGDECIQRAVESADGYVVCL